MTPLDTLLDSIFDHQKPAFYAEFKAWVQNSRRFKAFATTYASKIRAKLKNAEGAVGRLDVRAELEAAYLLLREARFTLEYEKYNATKQRGPDLSLTFKTHTSFNVEVRRLRSLELDMENAEARIHKLMAVLADKVKQMPPSVINWLWLVSEDGLQEADVHQAATTLRQLAEQKNEAFFTQRGYKSAAQFLRQYQQLNGVIIPQAEGNTVWVNALARHNAPPEMITALRRLQP